MNRKLSLSRSEVRAIEDYVFMHTRGSPNGTGYKVWQKMREFLDSDQGELFKGRDSKKERRQQEDG
jgi:hypothetical protein